MNKPRNDFATHLKYIETLKFLSQKLTIEVIPQENYKHEESRQLQDKINLLRLTKKSMKDDRDIMNMCTEYAIASSAWMPIKAYYLVYHTLCVFYYLTSGDIKHLTLTHGLFKKHFKDIIEKKILTFSQKLFNNAYNKDILKFTSKIGSNLKKHTDHEQTYKLIMKKQMKETKKNFNLTDKKKSKKVTQNKDLGTVCILDFLYLMRERTNYKNSNFLDGIKCEHIIVYCKNYYEFINNFLSPFEKSMQQSIKSFHDHT